MINNAANSGMGHLVIVKTEEQPKHIEVKFTNDNFDPTRTYKSTLNVKTDNKIGVLNIPANGNVASTLSDALRDSYQEGNKKT